MGNSRNMQSISFKLSWLLCQVANQFRCSCHHRWDPALHWTAAIPSRHFSHCHWASMLDVGFHSSTALFLVFLAQLDLMALDGNCSRTESKRKKKKRKGRQDEDK